MIWLCRVNQYFGERREDRPAKQHRRISVLVEAEDGDTAIKEAYAAGQRFAEVPAGLRLIAIEVVSASTQTLPFKVPT